MLTMVHADYQIWRPVAEESRESLIDLQQYAGFLLHEAGLEYQPVPAEHLGLQMVSRYAIELATARSAQFAGLSDRELSWNLWHDSPNSFHSPLHVNIRAISLDQSTPGFNIAIGVYSNALKRDCRHIASTYERLTALPASALPRYPHILLGRTSQAVTEVPSLPTQLERLTPTRILLQKPKLGRRGRVVAQRSMPPKASSL